MACKTFGRCSLACRGTVGCVLLILLSTFALGSEPSTQPTSQPASPNLEIRIYRSKYLSAVRVAEIIDQTFLAPLKAQSAVTPEAGEIGYVRSVVAEPQTNSVVVVGNSFALDNIQRILDSLTPIGSPSELRIFKLAGNANSAADLLNALFKETQDTTAVHSHFSAAADSGRNVLAVATDPGSMKIAEDLVARITAEDEDHAFQLTTVQVSHVSATHAAMLLRNLFSESNSRATSRPFDGNLKDSVNAIGDDERKIVILAGSKMWVHRAEQALKELDVPPTTQSLSAAK